MEEAELEAGLKKYEDHLRGVASAFNAFAAEE